MCRPLKVFLISLAVGWVQSQHKLQLDPKYKLPKMRYKGTAISSQFVRIQRKPLISEMPGTHSMIGCCRLLHA